MKLIYYFMIGLVLFNFYACTKQQTLDQTNLSENSKLEITYLDENNNPTENRTDDILMKLEEDDSGFIMVSRKAEETDEYIDYLIDTKNESTISMYYKNGESFPYKIVIVQGEESMIGYTSGYRESSRDFDIIWQMQEGSSETYETFKDIPISSVFNHGKTAGVDEATDYQIKTLKVSVRVADAINKYIDNNRMKINIWGHTYYET